MTHLSTLTLNRYRYGELDEQEASAVAAHVGSCDRCRARLQAQQAERAAFELEPVPQAIRAAPVAPPRANRWLWLGAPLLAAALALTVVTAPEVPQAAPTDQVRIKGADERLQVWVETPEGPRAIADGATLRAGDRVQFSVRRPPAPWVTLAGADADGVEVYGTWQPRDTPEWQPAPFALGLEGSGEQRFHAVFTEGRPTPAQVVQALSNGGDLEPVHTETFRFEIR